MQLSDTRVLLTGATGGIGHAIARALAARGASLILTGRRVDVLEPLAAELGASAVACDFADRAALGAFLAGLDAIDILVANAALPASGAFTAFDRDHIDRALDVNLRTPMILAHELAPAMVSRGRGHFVFISSIAGKVSAPGSALYSATKFGLRGFALGLREDLKPAGVGVSTIFPGFISDAGMFADANAKLPKGVGTKTSEQVAAAVVKAIGADRSEIDVAPVGVRAGAALAQIAPSFAAAVQTRLGAHEVSARIAAGQQDKR